MKKIACILWAATLPLIACQQSTELTNSASSPAPEVTKKAKGVEVTLKSVQVSRDIGPSGIIPTAPSGATYVVVVYNLKNTGADALPFEEWPQPSLIDTSEHPLQPEVMNSTMLSAAANASWAETLNPNLSTEAALVWKVDEKSFDRATWKVRFAATPPLVFSLK